MSLLPILISSPPPEESQLQVLSIVKTTSKNLNAILQLIFRDFSWLDLLR